MKTSILLQSPDGATKAWQCSVCSYAHRKEAEAKKCCACPKCGEENPDRGYACVPCREKETHATSISHLRHFRHITLRCEGNDKWEAECYHLSPPEHIGFGSTPEAALADLHVKREELKRSLKK